MDVRFFSEFRSPDGKMHWAVNVYNTSSGVVTFMRDLKFENVAYSEASFEDDIPKGRFYVDEVRDEAKFVVIDRMHDKVIASFCELPDANHFCDMKNADELYAEAIA